MILDKWQQQVMEYQGNVTVRAGRQVGKSEVIARKVKELAEKYQGTVTLVVAPSQRQSSLTYGKIKDLFDVEHFKKVDAGIKVWQKKHTDIKLTMRKRRELEFIYGIYNDEPTQTRIILKGKCIKTDERWENGSIIYSLPAGKTGAFIRGFTVDFLVGEEAAYIAEAVWVAIIPMLAVSQKLRGFGWQFLISTPFGKGGHFYNSCMSKDFLGIHVNAEKCSRIPKDFLRKERDRLTKAEYSQEWLGEFVDELSQFFPTAIIKKCMTFINWNYKDNYNKEARYYLGVDVARYGGDSNAFVFVEMLGKAIKIVKCSTTERKSIPDTVGRVLEFDRLFNFRKIFVDDAGVGGGVMDLLLEKLGRKILGLNNASRSIDRDNTKRKILKEDLYSNALVMMERENNIEIVSDMDLLKSLKSMTFEYTSDRNLRIFGKNSHLSEAFVRGLWCEKAKGLKLFLA